MITTFADPSTDSDGSITSRSWDFGDGTSSTQASTAKTCAASGTYVVKLTATVTDNSGLTHSKSEIIAVGVSTPPRQTYSNNGTEYAIADNATVETPVTVANRPGTAPSDVAVAAKTSPIPSSATSRSIWRHPTARSQCAAQPLALGRQCVLGDLSGESYNGTWKLRANDSVANDNGRIDTWSITF